MIKLVTGIVTISLLSLISACKEKAQQANNSTSSQIMIVEMKPVYKTLYFSGTLSPNKQVSVVSPNDGVVLKKNFQYGEQVQKGQLLFVIESSKQASQFQTAFSSYLKAKEQLNNDYGTFQSTQNLYDKGLVSRDDLTQAKSSYYLSQLSLLQAQSQLKDSLKYYQFNTDVFSLSIEDIKAISNTIAKSLKAEELHITSPATGIALLPVQNSQDNNQGNSNTNNTIMSGVQVKDSQVLVTIGLMQGLAMHSEANEIDINELSKGLSVSVTSVAFPDITLQGYLADIAAQATNSGNLPVFSIRIVMPILSQQAKQVVKIGMSAKAAIKIKEQPQIAVPISAVFIDPKTSATMVTKVVQGKHQNVNVTTGETSLNSVVILSGLNPGDEIVTNHQSE
ncbi:MAG: hypothetical protein A3E87_08900 [Gammaproteobacteria bacterium RIFCSPHIGHO2_12_FULL_35_23]|nr:MAG: hypothetical protein A3E87_08900 [Gammaproteobacteria bacterium RIFCSPHIGHO2_12_FULL_35_23]